MITGDYRGGCKGWFLDYVRYERSLIRFSSLIVCKIPLLARALGQARATIGYLVYKFTYCTFIKIYDLYIFEILIHLYCLSKSNNKTGKN